MTIKQTDVVDFISKEKNGNVCLTISDHLEWDEKMEHLYTLQEKINKYLSFIVVLISFDSSTGRIRPDLTEADIISHKLNECKY
ncbi:MAG: DUF6572 domain-containing protein [Candidatus Thiodiazotropha sp.]